MGDAYTEESIAIRHAPWKVAEIIDGKLQRLRGELSELQRLVDELEYWIRAADTVGGRSEELDQRLERYRVIVDRLRGALA